MGWLARVEGVALVPEELGKYARRLRKPEAAEKGLGSAGMHWKRWPILLVVLVVLAGVLWWSQSRSRPVVVSGFIEADEIRLGSRVGGRVAKVHVEEGQRVKAGEVMVELEPFDLLEKRAQAQANLAERQAEYQRLKAGFRSQEIEQARARRDQAKAVLDRLLAGPRPEEIAASRAAVEEAEAQVALAELTYRRVKETFERQAATPHEMDQARQNLAAARARLEAARQHLALLEAGSRAEEIAQARAALEEAEAVYRLSVEGYRPEEIAAAEAAVAAAQAALEAIDRQIEELVIRAPVDGLVEAVDLQPGDLVGPGAPVLTILDDSRLWVRAYVPERHLNLQVGQEVAVSVDAFPGRRFRGRVTFIARQGEFTPGNVQTPEERSKQVFRIKVHLLEGQDMLRAGMMADVWLEKRD